MHHLSGPVADLDMVPVGIAVLEPDGTIADRNAAWDGGAILDTDWRAPDGNAPSYFELCTPEAACKLREVIDGRCPVFTSIQAFEFSAEPVLQVALPGDLIPPSRLILLHINLAYLLSDDIAHAILRQSRQPDSNTFSLDLIVRTIERTLSKTPPAAPAGPARPTGERTDETDIWEEQRKLLSKLSRRQWEVLALIGAGKSNTEIADALGITMNTTKLHVAAIVRRLHLNNRLQAVALGSRVLDGRRTLRR